MTAAKSAFGKLLKVLGLVFLGLIALIVVFEVLDLGAGPSSPAPVSNVASISTSNEIASVADEDKPQTVVEERIRYKTEMRSAEKRTLRECLNSIQNAASPNGLKVITDKPDLVSGELENGEFFSCRKKTTGTKGTYFEARFAVKVPR